MARTSTEIARDIDDLRKARASGARRVEFGSGATRHAVDYRSIPEMDAALAGLETELAALTAPTGMRRIAYLEHDRG